jgi:uncharacterized protein (DUF2141 family)
MAGARDNTSTGNLIVIINNLENNKGEVLSHLFCGADGYPTESEKCLQWTHAVIRGGSARLVFENISFGEYALTTHHDANGNGIMDKNFLGMPAEGYGFSKNFEVLLAVPSFEECKFDFTQDGQKIYIEMRY